MIVVKVELHSAIDGSVTLLNSVVLGNMDNRRRRLRSYAVASYRKHVDPVRAVLSGKKPLRLGEVKGHPAEAVSVLTLVRKALETLGY